MDKMAKQNPQAIEIFLDKKMNILFIPMLHRKPGFGKETSYYKTLESPYTCADMGKVFLQVLSDMKSEPILNGDENILPAFKIVTGGKGYVAIERNRQMVSATFDKGIKFEYWYRKSRGFGIDKGDKEIVNYLPLESSEREIGAAIDAIFFEVNQKHIADEV